MLVNENNHFWLDITKRFSFNPYLPILRIILLRYARAKMGVWIFYYIFNLKMRGQNSSQIMHNLEYFPRMKENNNGVIQSISSLIYPHTHNYTHKPLFMQSISKSHAHVHNKKTNLKWKVIARKMSILNTKKCYVYRERK